jgi:hypothetical protein
VDAAWDTVVRASSTVQTESINLTNAALPPPPKEQIYQRPPVTSPALFACRSYKKGRVCALNQWRQFSVASGNKWVMNNQILSTGSGGRPSDFGRLLTNAYHWLATPSASVPGIGGFKNTVHSLRSPNESPAVIAGFNELTWAGRPHNADGMSPHYDVKRLEGVDPAPNLPRVYADPGSIGDQPGFHRMKGVIGARTNYSTGKSTVAEYAKAAAKAGLQFVVFLDEYWLDGTGDKLMTPAILSQLNKDCIEHSTPTLSLYAGFSMKNNIGNTMFAFGPTVNLPSADPKAGMMTPDNRLFMIQPIDPAAPKNFTGYNGPSMNWCISPLGEIGKVNSPRANQKGWTVGYYHLGETRTPGSMAMYDLRGFSAAGLVYYDSAGSLIEGPLLDDYMVTSESTIAPVPLVISEVATAAALLKAVRTQYINNVMVYDMNNLFSHGLRWSSQYDSMPVFAAKLSGPEINGIGDETARAYVLANEKFVTGTSVQFFPVSINSTVPLKEVIIYSGTKVFRRFSFDGTTKVLQRLLLLDEFVHKNLNLVVRDVEGGVAMGTTRRNWKPGSGRQIIYCGDHFNACDPTGVLLARGPFRPLASYVVPLPGDIAGGTWDGGPPPSLPLLSLEMSFPIVVTLAGTEDVGRFTQIPRLEYSDEGSVAITSLQNRVINDRVEHVINEWHTFGPIDGPSKIANVTLRYREYYGPNLGVPETGYPGFALTQGTIGTLFRSEITCKVATTINSIQILQTTIAPHATSMMIAYAATASGPVNTFNATFGSKPTLDVVIKRGGWWGAWSPTEATNSHVWYNRGADVRIVASATAGSPSTTWFFVYAAAQNVSVAAGTALAPFEFAQIGIALTQEIHTLADMTELVAWLDKPSGLVVAKGTRTLRNGGLFDIDVGSISAEATGAAYVAELSVGQHAATDMMLPVHVTGLQPRWTAGMWQHQGYAMGHYSDGNGVYTALGQDDFSSSFVPLYVGKSQYHVSIGHPIIATGDGAAELIIQTTRINGTAANPIWHVSLNNPTAERTLSVKLKVAMPELIGLVLPASAATVTLKPGEFRNVL